MEHLIDILRTISKQLPKLIIVPVITMALIYYFTRNTPSYYKTEAKIYLNLQEGKSTSLTDEDLKQYQVHTYFQNTIELLKANRTIERVKLKALSSALAGEGFFQLGNQPLLQDSSAISERIKSLQQNGSLDGSQPVDKTMIAFLDYHQLSNNRLRDIITSFRIMDSHFLKFELKETMPDKTLALARFFIEALVEENKLLAMSKIKGHKDIIEKLVQQAKNDLDNKIQKLEQFKSQNNIINLGEHTKAIVVYLVQLEGQRANLMAKIAASKKGKREIISTVATGNELMIDLSNHKEIIAMREQLKVMNRKKLEASFSQNDTVAFNAIEQNINQTKNEIADKITDLVRKKPYDPTRIQLDLATKYLHYDLEDETSIDMVPIINAEIQRVTGYASRFAPFESTIGAYEQEIATANNVYITLLNKLNLTETLEYGSGENVLEVVDAPYLPSKPEPSKRMIIVAAGGFVIFFLMTGVFIAIQLLDDSITSVEKFERLSKLPVVAAIPGLTNKSSNDYSQSVQNQQLIKLAHTLLSNLNPENNLILFTASQPGEGKHFIVEKIQQCMARGSKKIAVVDADWTSPAPTSTDYIDMRELVRQDAFILHQNEITQKIQELKADHDMVVVITSPLRQSSEINFWLTLSQQLVHVFKANRLFTKVDRRIEEKLLSSASGYKAAVLNQLDIENMEDYLGEIAKKRTSFRKIIKKILTRNLK